MCKDYVQERAKLQCGLWFCSIIITNDFSRTIYVNLFLRMYSYVTVDFLGKHMPYLVDWPVDLTMPCGQNSYDVRADVFTFWIYKNEKE